MDPSEIITKIQENSFSDTYTIQDWLLKIPFSNINDKTIHIFLYFFHPDKSVYWYFLSPPTVIFL